MGIKMVSLKCPECSASFSLEKSGTFGFCPYCGVKILLDNPNRFVHENIDHADILKEENRRLELEFEKRKYEDDAKQEKKNLVFTILLFIALIVAYLITKSF